MRDAFSLVLQVQMLEQPTHGGVEGEEGVRQGVVDGGRRSRLRPHTRSCSPRQPSSPPLWIYRALREASFRPRKPRACSSSVGSGTRLSPRNRKVLEKLKK